MTTVTSLLGLLDSVSDPVTYSRQVNPKVLGMSWMFSIRFQFLLAHVPNGGPVPFTSKCLEHTGPAVHTLRYLRVKHSGPKRSQKDFENHCCMLCS